MDIILYREVSADGGVRQAMLIVLLAALISSLNREFVLSITWANVDASRFTSLAQMIDQRNIIQKSTMSTIIMVAVWPIWATGFWLVGSRLAGANATSVRLGSVAKAIAFAQTPAMLGVSIPVLFVAFTALQKDTAFSNLGDSPLTLMTTAIDALLGIWIAVGTFIAIRSSLRLSDARALATFAITALCLLPVLSVTVAGLSYIAGFATQNRPLGFFGITAFNVIASVNDGLQFNLNVVRLTSFTSATMVTLRQAFG